MKTYSEEYFNDYEVEPEDIWCEMCLKRGYKNRLGGKILQPNEPRPEDYENWLECGICGWLCPIHEIPKEETIKDAVETIESPFEQGKFILESIPKRNSAAGKKLLSKKRKSKIKLDSDPEIDALLRAYGTDRVKVLK
jgi:hypothetical protein